MLASAIARRPVRVLSAAPGELAWTDGAVIYVDTHTTDREQIDALAVQASLLAAGSFGRDIVRALARRPAVSKRYLALEAPRALAECEPRLPPTVCRWIPRANAARVSSSDAALREASGRSPIADPPKSFGTIHAKKLLAAIRSADARSAQRAGRTTVSQQALAELADDAVTEEEDASLFENPSGGGGAIGKWLAKMLKSVRQLQGGGTPGADAPTHWSRSGLRSRNRATLGDAAGPAGDDRAREKESSDTRYPEWDFHAGHYRMDWCTVHAAAPTATPGSGALDVPDRTALRRALARLGLGIERVARQTQGDEIDVDAVIAARIEALCGVAPEEKVFVDNQRRKRDLSVLLLLDISGSTAEAAQSGGTVHDVQRVAAAALMLSLHELGDRVALYSYCSQGRAAVHVTPIKRFGEDAGAQVLQRLSSLKPGAYSRLGAAIRHGTAVLQDHGGTRRQLLVVLSDGLAYDHGYEPAYGAADARRALNEARRDGVGCLCLSIGASTDTDALQRVFGSAAHATLPGPEHLSRTIGQLFLSAIRSADVRRRVS